MVLVMESAATSRSLRRFLLVPEESQSRWRCQVGGRGGERANDSVCQALGCGVEYRRGDGATAARPAPRHIGSMRYPSPLFSSLFFSARRAGPCQLQHFRLPAFCLHPNDPSLATSSSPNYVTLLVAGSLDDRGNPMLSVPSARSYLQFYSSFSRLL